MHIKVNKSKGEACQSSHRVTFAVIKQAKQTFSIHRSCQQ